MKKVSLTDAYERAVQGQLNGTNRVHPHVDTGNGDGSLPMAEISRELEGGDWQDIAFCYNPMDAALLAHAFNVLPELVGFLQSAKEAADNCEGSIEGLIELRAWFAARVETILERASTVEVPD